MRRPRCEQEDSGSRGCGSTSVGEGVRGGLRDGLSSIVLRPAFTTKASDGKHFPVREAGQWLWDGVSGSDLVEVPFAGLALRGWSLWAVRCYFGGGLDEVVAREGDCPMSDFVPVK